jgi:hypothetical protein
LVTHVFQFPHEPLHLVDLWIGAIFPKIFISLIRIFDDVVYGPGYSISDRDNGFVVGPELISKLFVFGLIKRSVGGDCADGNLDEELF